MKKIYLLGLFIVFVSTIQAQAQSAVTACKKPSGEIDIFFDVSKNCTLGPAGSADTLGSRTEIGFHSGANGWAVVREWDLPASVHGVRVSGTGTSSLFKVTLTDPAAYYGLAVEPTAINFVFNDGAQGNTATSNFPWYAEGKDQGAAGCLDFFVAVADLATCSTSSTEELDQKISVLASPNPFSASTVLTFDNPKGESYSLTLLNAMGQQVRSYANIRTGAVEIQREDLAKGIYFAVLQDIEGRWLTQKLIVE